MMNVMNYIARQRANLKDRHDGDEILLCRNCAPARAGEEAPSYRSVEEILYELDNLKGLNKKERMAYARAFRPRRMQTARA